MLGDKRDLSPRSNGPDCTCPCTFKVQTFILDMEIIHGKEHGQEHDDPMIVLPK